MKDSRQHDLAFEAFLESETYDAAESALFAIAAKAFEAGWLAAGGEPLSRPEKDDKYAFLRALMHHHK